MTDVWDGEGGAIPPTCPMCGNVLYMDLRTTDLTCARCCPPTTGEHLVLVTLLANPDNSRGDTDDHG